MSPVGPSRREFVKQSVYVAPAIVSLAVAPSFAKAGSGKPESWGGSDNEDRGRPESPGKSGDAPGQSGSRGPN